MEESNNEPQISENPVQQNDKPSELVQQLEQPSTSSNHYFDPFENNSQSTKKEAKKNPIKKFALVIITVLGTLLLLSGTVIAYDLYVENTNQNTNQNTQNTGGGVFRHRFDKPIIYLYPTKTQNVKVELKLNGELTSTYPKYNESINGWEVTANPNGSLINLQDGKEYSYLFWEGLTGSDYSNLDTGFVIKGSDTKDFLQSTLAKLGLTAKEYNEMIVYWLPKMEHNKYNLIYFAGKDYTDTAKLTIAPTPNSMLRVFMVFKPLDKYILIPPQQLESFERKGFTVIEWGGTEIK